MDKFIEKWQSDKKYRAKIKLLLYSIFIIIITIYAVYLNKNQPINSILDDNLPNEVNEKPSQNIISIPKNYKYKIDIIINGGNYEYAGIVSPNKTTITKNIHDKTTNYIYQNNEYYVEQDNLYVKTTKDEVYDIIKYNYINLETINEYLSKATKDSNQYLVYLKDIILGNDSNEYFVILVNNNNINIDYTPLMKQFNNAINNYQVNIQIEEIE